MKRTLGINLIILAIVLTQSINARSADVPSAIPYQGHLTDAGGIDLTANVPIEVRLYDSLIAGLGQGVTNSHVIYAERHDAIRIENGNFRLKIGEGTSLDAKWTGLPVNALVSKENIYLELWIDGERLSPRQKMGSVPTVIKAEYAKYADSLSTLPTITESILPVYDASKITSGVFAASQIPNLSTSSFASGTLSPSNIPALDAGKFSVGSTQPKISTSLLPPNIRATKIVGDPVSLDRLPAGLLLDDSVAIGSGKVNHHEMIVLPSGFASGECKIWYSLAQMIETAENGLTTVNTSLDGDNVLTCTYTPPDRSHVRQCYANYLYVCKKG